ncbi:hypothetical protein ACFOOK_00015 [Micromonospora krabiensis]|uniref:hypothetical protein n=1 Tax=Micromonospora krabiensis TaxID=307121 RepID=UPI003612D1A2
MQIAGQEAGRRVRAMPVVRRAGSPRSRVLSSSRTDSFQAQAVLAEKQVGVDRRAGRRRPDDRRAMLLHAVGGRAGIRQVDIDLGDEASPCSTRTR